MTETTPYGGWVMIPRSFLGWEWYADTNCVRLALHFILKANYVPKKWCGITIGRGQFVTSRSRLAEQTGLSQMQVRTAVEKMLECGFITKSATNCYTVITICDYDAYQPLSRSVIPDFSPSVTGPQPSRSQSLTTTKEGNNVINKEEYTHTVELKTGGVEVDRADAAAGSGGAVCRGAAGAGGAAWRSGGADAVGAGGSAGGSGGADAVGAGGAAGGSGGADAVGAGGAAWRSGGADAVGAGGAAGADAAGELLAWIGSRFPQIAAMAEPFTREQAAWVLNRYPAAEVRRLIAQMDNKGAFKNRSAYATFSGFAGRDFGLQGLQGSQGRGAGRRAGRGYTYEEFCDLTGHTGRYAADDFERVVVGGAAVWRFRQPGRAPRP